MIGKGERLRLDDDDGTFSISPVCQSDPPRPGGSTDTRVEDSQGSLTREKLALILTKKKIRV